jgi:hypothetical protein
MNGNKRLDPVLSTLFIASIFLPSVCNWLWIWLGFGYSLEGVHGSSYHIKEAKERKVFLGRYEIYPSSFKVDDTFIVSTK